MTDDDEIIEKEIQAKGLTAPRVTPADIEANITSEHYFTAAQGVDGADIERLRAADQTAELTIEPMANDPQIWRTGSAGPLHLLTFCVLVLRNGHTVSGESYCADPAKFNAETGRIEARKVAINKLWPMAVYAERERLAGA